MPPDLDALQTQRHALLAAHTAASDRTAQQEIEQQLHRLSEELELVAAAPSRETATLSADFYASYLVLVLLSGDLNDARFLWRRITTETKDASVELRNVWAIGKALWQRNLAAAFAAMDYDWSPLLQGLVQALKLSTREAMAELLCRAYSTIPVTDVALAMGFARHEEAVQYCLSLGWAVSEAGQWVLPKPLANVRRRHSSGVDMAQLDTLSKTVLHLEQNTVAILQ
ncbi:unnamed protein product [Hyaloperonospora brassicae]|uniref:CSN8/PSMD8/EIF3K domain-containing protein n=1 Tax=Hyaloperonospora brassicae TaxID=162125 RepID=A0AAV0ULA1_HYABA|nr:unnamed protein product [Hyaloperonospora brassicae]